MSARIALATCRALPHLDDDDHGFVAALRARGATVTTPVWDDADSDWAVDVVVVRSTWDYSERRDAFLAWAARVEATTTLCNPSTMLAWNTDKRRYLCDLERARVRTVPTLWLSRRTGRNDELGDPRAGDVMVLDRLVRAAPWAHDVDAVVVKPTIGAGSRDTVKLAVADLASVGARFVAEQAPKQALMVQPFLPSIAEGEVSLLYVDGAYSHAVKKVPRDGDFRSQSDFGARTERHTPSPDERQLADDALHACGGFPLYARVDVVRGLDGRPAVIELELTEPTLFFGYDDDAAARFADAVLARARAAQQKQQQKQQPKQQQKQQQKHGARGGR